MTATLYPVAREPDLVAQDALLATVPPTGTGFRIGDREYVVNELRLGPMLKLSSLLVSEVQAALQSGQLDLGILGRLESGDLTGDNLGNLLGFVGDLLDRAPKVVGQALALMLGATQPDDGAYILDQIPVADVPDVLLAFMGANPWQDIVQKLFRVGREIRAALPSRPATVTSSPTPTP
jgi:hypothetical protein